MGDDKRASQPRRARKRGGEPTPSPVAPAFNAWDEGGRVDEIEESADDDLDLDIFDRLDDLGGVQDLDEGISTSALRRVIDGVLGRVLSGGDVRRVFGEPLTRGDVTVIPLADVRYGFGFGGGGGEGEEGEGGGAGGGGSVGARPIGFIEVTPAGARFVPTTDTSRLATVGATIGGVAALLLLRRLLR